MFDVYFSSRYRNGRHGGLIATLANVNNSNNFFNP